MNKSNNKRAPLNDAIKKDDLELVEKLLKTKINLNRIPAGQNSTPLTLACYYKNNEIAKALIKAGADVNKKDKKGDTPIKLACDAYEDDSKKIAELTKLLLENGADPNIFKRDTDGPINSAAMYGHLEAVKLLIKHKANIDKKGNYGRTALMYAASCSRSIKIVKALLKSGADVNIENEGEENALFEVITNEKSNVEIAKLLISAGTKINRGNHYHGSALHWAAFCGRTNIVKLLLENGADINKNHKNSGLPISEAMSQGCTKIVKILFDHWINSNSKQDLLDSGILEYAVEKKDMVFTKKIIAEAKKRKKKLPGDALVEAARTGDLELTKLLIAAGLSPEEGQYSETPLMKAAYYGRLSIVKYLLDNGANLAAKDCRGNTALLHAAWSGRTNVVRELLKQGAKINEKNNLNWNALMQACIEKHIKTAEFLLKKGSPTDEIDKEKGVTALTLAKHSGSKELIDLLISHGATERKIKQRKKGEEYFSIFDCEICSYLPHKKDLWRTLQVEEFKGLESIYTEHLQPDRHTEVSNMIKKCTNCGTYYHQYYSVDDEDAFIAGPSISHNFRRLNLEELKVTLRKIKKTEELNEFKKRYPSIIKDLESKLKKGETISKNLLLHVIESLTDYYITKENWEDLEKYLLQNSNPEIALQTARDLCLIYGVQYYDHRMPYYTEYRDCTTGMQKKAKPFIKKHNKNILQSINKFKDDKNPQVKLKYDDAINSMKYYKLKPSK
ncbi:hypothetical protein HOG48_00310 [Candidatus Peregrinibacteria bacterium]|jgi:ankyrin repeat protein|nr:hypothetical protein [Candidatus Peregrinibacteria bacterium]